MHLGIASRAFGSVGPVAKPVRLVHDTIARTTYGLVGGALRAGGRGAGLVAAITAGADGWPETERAGVVEGIVCGIWGDHLADRHPELAIRMALRSGGRDVALEREALRASYPAGGARLAVFLHGLCETELAWGRPAADDDSPGTYGDRLRKELGMTPLFVRYNSGLPVAENGRSLAALIDELLREWPDAVDEISIVGHSMGGLVARAACDVAFEDRLPWVDLVRHCIHLGTPHDGAPLERGAERLSRLLRRLPETAAISRVIDVRSTGIKDLRFGYRGGAPGHTGIRHHVVGATLGPTRRHPLTFMFGDLLVTPASAAGRSRRGTALVVAEEDRKELAGLSHFALLAHPEVAEALVEWLRDARPRETGQG